MYGLGAVVVFGPGRLEIFFGDPNASGNLLRSNSERFANSHVYASADAGLSILDHLLVGRIFVQAIDQAGNEETIVSFTTLSPSAVVERVV